LTRISTVSSPAHGQRGDGHIEKLEGKVAVIRVRRAASGFATAKLLAARAVKPFFADVEARALENAVAILGPELIIGGG
jgi:hypothetical protein